jgi:hypothetical protein
MTEPVCVEGWIIVHFTYHSNRVSDVYWIVVGELGHLGRGRDSNQDSTREVDAEQ